MAVDSLSILIELEVCEPETLADVADNNYSSVDTPCWIISVKSFLIA